MTASPSFKKKRKCSLKSFSNETIAEIFNNSSYWRLHRPRTMGNGITWLTAMTHDVMSIATAKSWKATLLQSQARSRRVILCQITAPGFLRNILNINFHIVSRLNFFDWHSQVKYRHYKSVSAMQSYQKYENIILSECMSKDSQENYFLFHTNRPNDFFQLHRNPAAFTDASKICGELSAAFVCLSCTKLRETQMAKKSNAVSS